MPKELWRDFAFCKQPGMSPDTFYPEQGDHRTAARTKKLYCDRCPVAVACLYASFTHHEPLGIRGGLGEDQRRRLRSNYRDMCVNHTVAGGHERFYRLCEVTVHLMRDSLEPEWIADRNTEGATHGRIATWNRGCRCGSCKAASSAVSYMRKVLPADEYEALRDEMEQAVDDIIEGYVPKRPVFDWNDEVAELEEAYAS